VGSHTEFLLFIFDSIRVITCKVSFLCTSFMAEMNKVSIKFCFIVGLSATETLLLVQKAYGNEALNRSYAVISISSRKEADR
jgi:hypothetical protein